MLKELIDLLDTRIQRVNSHWGFCLTITLVLIGWLISGEAKINETEKKLVLSFALLVPYFFNFRAIFLTKKEIVLLINDIRNLKKEQFDNSPLLNTEFVNHIINKDMSWYIRKTLFIFGFVFIIVYGTIWGVA